MTRLMERGRHRCYLFPKVHLRLPTGRAWSSLHLPAWHALKLNPLRLEQLALAQHELLLLNHVVLLLVHHLRRQPLLVGHMLLLHLLVHQVKLHLLLLLLLLLIKELVVGDCFGALRSNAPRTELILNLLSLECASCEIVGLNLDTLVLRSYVHGLASGLELRCHDGLLGHALVHLAFVEDRLRVLVSFILVRHHQSHTTDFVGLQLIVLSLRLIVVLFHIDHLVASILLILFLFVLRHEVLEVRVWISVHSVFLSVYIFL